MFKSINIKERTSHTTNCFIQHGLMPLWLLVRLACNIENIWLCCIQSNFAMEVLGKSIGNVASFYGYPPRVRLSGIPSGFRSLATLTAFQRSGFGPWRKRFTLYFLLLITMPPISLTSTLILFERWASKWNLFNFRSLFHLFILFFKTWGTFVYFIVNKFTL